MPESASHSGTCPFCGTQLQSAVLLIEYEVGNETRAYFECTRCEQPVQPQ